VPQGSPLSAPTTGPGGRPITPTATGGTAVLSIDGAPATGGPDVQMLDSAVRSSGPTAIADQPTTNLKDRVAAGLGSAAQTAAGVLSTPDLGDFAGRARETAEQQLSRLRTGTEQALGDIPGAVRSAARSDFGQGLIEGVQRSAEESFGFGQPEAMRRNIATLADPRATEQERNLAFLGGVGGLIAPEFAPGETAAAVGGLARGAQQVPGLLERGVGALRQPVGAFLREEVGGGPTAFDRATRAGGDLLAATTGPVRQQLQQDLRARLSPQELEAAAQTLAQVPGGSSALNPYPAATAPEGLAKLRRQLVSLARQGEAQRDWYDLSSREIMDAAQGDKADAEKIAQLAGIYSNNTAVDQNMDLALTAWHQWKAGEPIYAPGMSGPNQRARDLLERGVQWEGRKTNNFYRNLMMHIDPEVFTQLGKESVDGVRQTGVTIDVWMQRALNSLRKSPSTQAQYDWAADEIRRVADQLGWRPDQAQAALWSPPKAGWEDEKFGTDLGRAGWSYADALRKRLTLPFGPSQEHLDQALRDPETGRDELARVFGLLGADGRVSLPQARQSETIGGKTVKYPENVGRIEPAARQAVTAYTAARGLLLGHDSVGWARLFPMDKVVDANAVKLTSSDGRFGAQAIAEMQGHLDDLLGTSSGVHVLGSDDGAWVLNRGATPNKAFHNAVESATKKLQSVADAVGDRARHDGEILTNDWEAHPDGDVYLAAIRQSGGDRFDQFQRARAILQPRLDAVRNAAPGAGEAAAEAGRGVRGGAQVGAASLPYAARLGGAAAGGYGGFTTTPEDASAQERLTRTALGAGAGFVAPGLALAAAERPSIGQATLRNLRTGGLVQGPPAPRAAQTAGGVITDLSRQGLLTNPWTHIQNIGQNVGEIIGSAAQLSMGGGDRSAVAGAAAAARALPESLANARMVMSSGRQVPTLGGEAQQIPITAGGVGGWVYRALAAGDIFTRTMAEYQGMAQRGLRMLDEAGLEPGTAAANSHLAANAGQLYREGAEQGARSVFGTVAARGGNVIDRFMEGVGRVKRDLQQHPNPLVQGLGYLLDTQVPFTGTPGRAWQIGVKRLPGVSQAAYGADLMRALRSGDTLAAHRAAGGLVLSTLIQLEIADQIRQGNIRGPDDPEHPSAARIGGEWVPLRAMPLVGLPMEIMASWADGWRKSGGKPDAELTDQFAGALNNSTKPFLRGVPGFEALRTLETMHQQGPVGAAADVLQSAVGRASPAILGEAERLTDPYQRDVATKGASQIWEGLAAKTPGLAQLLPPRIDPTTGEPMPPRSGGPGSLIGIQNRDASRLQAEADKLVQKGFTEAAPPRHYPDSVSIGGSSIPLKPDQQRAITVITGKMLGDLGKRLDSAEYQNASDERKALMLKAWFDAADRARTSAAVQVLGRDRIPELVARYRDVAGRPVARGSGPSAADEGGILNFLSSSGELAIDQARALAGSR
jgi:hypothetical protein